MRLISIFIEIVLFNVNTFLSQKNLTRPEYSQKVKLTFIKQKVIKKSVLVLDLNRFFENL